MTMRWGWLRVKEFTFYSKINTLVMTKMGLWVIYSMAIWGKCRVIVPLGWPWVEGEYHGIEGEWVIWTSAGIGWSGWLFGVSANLFWLMRSSLLYLTISGQWVNKWDGQKIYTYTNKYQSLIILTISSTFCFIRIYPSIRDISENITGEGGGFWGGNPDLTICTRGNTDFAKLLRGVQILPILIGGAQNAKIKGRVEAFEGGTRFNYL